MNQNLKNENEQLTPTKQMILWWEKRRFFYNLIVLFPSSILYFLWFDWINCDVPMNEGLPVQFMRLLIFINICYTFTWVFGWMNQRTFKPNMNRVKHDGLFLPLEQYLD